MKKIFNTIIVTLTLAALFLTGCGSAPQSGDEGLSVLASTSFLADIAQNVAGDRLTVKSLLPIGADPHAYQAAPSDVSKIAESDILILNGVEYEHFIEPLLENAGGERLVIEAAAGLTPHQMDEHSGSHADLACQQISGKTLDIQAGSEADAAVELSTSEEHSHERDIYNVQLNPQADGSFAGYLFYDVDEEADYVFTASSGTITVKSLGNIALQSEESFEMDCAGMTNGIVYPLFAGRYIVELTGSELDVVSFSAGSVHAEETATDDSHAHEAGDPHMWLDPNLVITYVENIRDGLTQADPAGADVYKSNAEAYIAQLQELDTFIKEQVETIPAERRLLVTNHEALGYFAERYGFEVVDTILPSFSSEASASAQEIAAAVDAVKNSGAPAIFLGEVENADLADQIASETGVMVVDSLYFESLTDGDPAPTYIAMMTHNVTQIVGALK